MTREEMRYKLNELRMMLNDGEHGEEQGVLVEIISELDKREWIPVSERLPEIDQNVLATTRWGALTIAERLDIGSDCWFICEGEANAHTEDIIAWQPLPRPYKAESEDK